MDITGILHPVQAICDWVMTELALAKHKDPPYEPYLAHSLASIRWLPQTADRAAALESWKALSKQARRDLLPRRLAFKPFVSIICDF